MPAKRKSATSTNTAEQLRARALQKARKKRAAHNLESVARLRAGLTLEESDSDQRLLRDRAQRAVKSRSRVAALTKSGGRTAADTKARSDEDLHARSAVQRQAQAGRALRQLRGEAEQLRRRRP